MEAGTVILQMFPTQQQGVLLHDSFSSSGNQPGGFDLLVLELPIFFHARYTLLTMALFDQPIFLFHLIFLLWFVFHGLPCGILVPYFTMHSGKALKYVHSYIIILSIILYAISYCITHWTSTFCDFTTKSFAFTFNNIIVMQSIDEKKKRCLVHLRCSFLFVFMTCWFQILYRKEVFQSPEHFRWLFYL